LGKPGQAPSKEHANAIREIDCRRIDNRPGMPEGMTREDMARSRTQRSGVSDETQANALRHGLSPGGCAKG
jgi:hypothetical protein